MKATHLRKNLFKVLDRVAQTGRSIEIECKGRVFKIIALEPPDKLAELQPHPDVYSGDLEDLVKIEWTSAWRP